MNFKKLEFFAKAVPNRTTLQDNARFFFTNKDMKLLFEIFKNKNKNKNRTSNEKNKN
jgi:hypothetical protein